MADTVRSAAVAGLEATGALDVAAELPIADAANDLVAAIASNQVVVVAGETGSGKSTQLPKLCLRAGRGRAGLVGHTQPRRVAARSVAERLAAETGTSIGGEIGYSVRFDDTVGDRTLIRVMTDGILLNEIQRDPTLAKYDTLIIDEAHERSLNIDFILGFLTQLLPKRPDLHLVITSATIDTERFAAHFGTADAPAPVFVVEGRTYPVEIRYRPFGADNPDRPDDRRDQVSAVVDAIDEVWTTDRLDGDILVFLSGEREIRDTADALGDHFATAGGPHTEILPLYARLSAHDQHRIFGGHRGRRVVLATNIAETSLTVPGIRAVVDTGTARISRYSRRLKVQRLPIEEISQASANQRSGRCGRVGPGLAIRLYSEENFDQRPEFTEPEILRTNLASVILQMTAIGLGDVARFPFLDPPDSSQISDGFRLLEELGALKAGRIGSPRKLTGTGRSLARLPVDPRLGRMIIEAGRLHCVREVLVIASALSIQDVRERPADAEQKAAESHNRFRVPGSDLLSIVSLWDYLGEQQRTTSSGAFRRMCRAEYFHYLRVREWRDLYSQLRRVAGQLSLRPATVAAHPDAVHRAVLSGLLSQIGERDRDGNEYLGARGARFVISRGSVVARKPPAWVMAAELVETNRLWAHRVAAIQPEWCEPLARHLTKRSYGEPRWEAEGGRAMVDETVTLYGRPIVSERPIGLDRVDPTLARHILIESALVRGEWAADGPPPGVDRVVDHNRDFLGRVARLEARVRRTDLYDERSLYEFYDARVPDDVTTVTALAAWWRDRATAHPDDLNFTNAILANRDGIDLADFPSTWRSGDADYALDYRLAPDTPLDGVSVVVPVAVLNRFDDDGLDWSIPGYRRDLIDHLVRGLPKQVRRDLQPLAEVVDRVADSVAQRAANTGPTGPFADAVAVAIEATVGRTVDPRLVRLDDVPTWLRTHIVVTGADGAVVDAGDNLAAIRERQQGAIRSTVAELTPVEEIRGATEWVFGDIPQVIERDLDDGGGRGHRVRSYPTLVDATTSVTYRAVDNEGLQRRAHHGGVRRLLLLHAATTPAQLAGRLDGRSQLTIAAAEIDPVVLAEDSVTAAADAVIAQVGLPWTASQYDDLAAVARTELIPLATDALEAAVDILAATGRIHRLLVGLVAAAWEPTVADAAAHRDRLAGPGFVRRVGTARLPDVHRYLRGIEYRLEHLDGNVERDRRRMDEVRPHELSFAAATADMSPVPEPVREVGWMLEELRVATFAAPIGAVGPISAKRIATAFTTATGRRL